MALYFCIFELNVWLFASLSLTQSISWIYLPAAVRLLSVLVLGWAAAVGLMLGTLLTIFSSGSDWSGSMPESLAVAFLSGIGPVIAVAIGARWFRLPSDLSGLRPFHLLKFSLLGAACNVFPHTFFFWLLGKLSNPIEGIGVMFTGDVLGTLIVLYIAGVSLQYFQRADTKLTR